MDYKMPSMLLYLTLNLIYRGPLQRTLIYEYRVPFVDKVIYNLYKCTLVAPLFNLDFLCLWSDVSYYFNIRIGDFAVDYNLMSIVIILLFMKYQEINISIET